MSGIRWALAVTTAERYLTLAISFAMTIVVSRLLTPAEVGVWAIGLATATTFLAFREFTTGIFLIQRVDLSREEIRSAFTIMLLMSVLIAGAIALSAPSIASFYGEARLTAYLRVAAVAILFEVIAAPLTALMRRDMAFTDLAIVNIVNITVFAVLTVALAALGFSYMSFAWAWAAAAALSGVLTICFRPDLWVFKPSLRHWRDMLTFGGYNGANVFLYRLYEAVPAMVLGRVQSFDAAGLYNRALLICQLPDKVILGGTITVILPALSAEVRAGRDLKQPYLRAVAFITALLWPALIITAILAHAIVHVLLGDQWLGVVWLVQIIALASFFSFFSELNIPVLVSLGAMKDVLLRGLIAWPASGLLIACAAFFGLTVVALSFIVIVPFQAYVSLYFVRRHLQLEWRELLSATWKSVIISAFSAIGPMCVVAWLGFRFDMSISAALAAGLLGGLGWLAGVWLTRHPLLAELQLARDTLAGFRRRAADGV